MDGNYDRDIIALDSAQKIAIKRMDEYDETLDALDRIIRGDYQNDRDGLISRFESMEKDLSRLNAVIFQDSTGKKGLVATVDALVSGRMDKVERRKSNVAIVVAIITTLGLILTNLDRIGDFWLRMFPKGKPTEIERIIEKGEHPHTTRIHPRRVIVYPHDEDSGSELKEN